MDLYNDWFMKFAPRAYREERVKATASVERTLELTENLRNLSPSILTKHPGILPTLRMCTCPPLARDRLVGLAGLDKHLVLVMEKEGRLPQGLSGPDLSDQLAKIGAIIARLSDKDIFPWLDSQSLPDKGAVVRASTIVADRLCGSQADPIIRNAQESRQLETLGGWLKLHGYKLAEKGTRFDAMNPGTFAYRLNVPVRVQGDVAKKWNIPVDVAVMPRFARQKELPLLIEAKSAGDFTNVNKRRKEEAQKLSQLRHTYGLKIRYVLFLCGYFDSGYLGYEASEGIDWIWEHRLEDLETLKL